jgi:hypothetical protein
MRTVEYHGLSAILAWSAVWVTLGTLGEARAGTVIINEIHYDPPDPTRLEEFVELYNLGSAQMDLSGWYFSSGIDYTFPAGTVIEPDGYLVVAQDPAAWAGRMLGVPLGPFEGALSSEGERLVLRNEGGLVEDEVDWQASFPWPLASAEAGARRRAPPLCPKSPTISCPPSRRAGTGGREPQKRRIRPRPGGPSTSWKMQAGPWARRPSVTGMTTTTRPSTTW